MFKRYITSLFAILIAGSTQSVIAVSFSADAVQIRDGRFSHARMHWKDDMVRFDYVQDGVSMAQIFDSKARRMIWLDTESKQFVERDLGQGQIPGRPVKARKSTREPCMEFESAECVKLKQVELRGRTADKWLLTFSSDTGDQHMFQWIDKELGVVIRQENPDGSRFDLELHSGLELNGRKVRKQEMFAVSADGLRMQGTQWIDEALDIIVRQENDIGEVDELRNIKIETIASDLFRVPEKYTPLKVFQSDPLDKEFKLSSTDETSER